MPHAYLNADLNEQFDFAFDFADMLGSASIISHVVTASNSAGTDVTADLLVGTATSGTLVDAVFAASAPPAVPLAGDTYMVTYGVVTNASPPRTYIKVLVLRYFDRKFQRYF